MAIIKSNLFLFLIAVFSYYLAYSGLRYARRRDQKPSKTDWCVSLIMILASISMILTGFLLYDIKNFHGQVLIVFGLLGASFSLNDFRLFSKGSLPYPIRISRHLAAMLGGTIAAYTAFLVTNVSFNPPIVLWLGPTVLITPLIIYWTNKVEKKPY